MLLSPARINTPMLLNGSRSSGLNMGRARRLGVFRERNESAWLKWFEIEIFLRVFMILAHEISRSQDWEREPEGYACHNFATVNHVSQCLICSLESRVHGCLSKLLPSVTPSIWSTQMKSMSVLLYLEHYMVFVGSVKDDSLVLQSPSLQVTTIGLVEYCLGFSIQFCSCWCPFLFLLIKP